MLGQGYSEKIDMKYYYCDEVQHQEINCKEIFENVKGNIVQNMGSNDESIAELGLLVL